MNNLEFRTGIELNCSQGNQETAGSKKKELSI